MMAILKRIPSSFVWILSAYRTRPNQLGMLELGKNDIQHVHIEVRT